MLVLLLIYSVDGRVAWSISGMDIVWSVSDRRTISVSHLTARLSRSTMDSDQFSNNYT